MPDHAEARITIEGQELTFAQSMAVRVAVANMLLDLADREAGRDLGSMSEPYRARLSEVQLMIFRGMR